ncbi:PaREP1 family protein [Sulfurisphaera ohwakuensis]|uniref:PaREP1 family protein n=1 Tax=Sulfurisphaera ohwakuensis TaxID=69656 RepID=UPI0036F374BB
MLEKIRLAHDVYFEEADELLSRGDLVQASEKYYKAAEEAIKYLIYVNSIKVEEWDLKTINSAVYELSKKYGDFVLEAWKSAVALDTVNLSKDLITHLREDIKKLIEIADRELYNQLAKRS